MRRVAIILSIAGLVACGGGKGSPTAPTPAPTPTVTRNINVGGDVQFGAVQLGQTATGQLRITNNGNAVVTVTSISAPSSACVSMFSLGWTSGQIQPGATQMIAFRFAPTAVINCSGNVTVNSDATGGIISIAISASGTLDGLPLFVKNGRGNQVFDMPTYIRRVRIQGTWDRTSNSNFIVWVGGNLIVNEILRQSITYDGTHAVTGGEVRIEDSNQITWTITELR